MRLLLLRLAGRAYSLGLDWLGDAFMEVLLRDMGRAGDLPLPPGFKVRLR